MDVGRMGANGWHPARDLAGFSILDLTRARRAAGRAAGPRAGGHSGTALPTAALRRLARAHALLLSVMLSVRVRDVVSMQMMAGHW